MCVHENVGMSVIIIVCVFVTVTRKSIIPQSWLRLHAPLQEDTISVSKSLNSPAHYPIPWVKIQVDNKYLFCPRLHLACMPKAPFKKLTAMKSNTSGTCYRELNQEQTAFSLFPKALLKFWYSRETAKCTS